MRKLLAFFILASAILGGWQVLQNYRIEGLEAIRLTPRPGGPAFWTSADNLPPPVRAEESIRIASFNIQVFGRSKWEKPDVRDILARIVRRFDLVAIQEIRSREQDLLPRFIDQINATGVQYDYVIGPPLGRSNQTEQLAFIFDRASIEVDRTQLYTVHDPDDLLHREPFVGWFRVRGPPASEAFTFSLVNVHTDPDEVAQELDVLDDVFRAVRDDGRGEDDVIMLGDFNADDRHLGELGQLSGLLALVTGVPTNTRGTQQYDNLLIHQPATMEFTGRSGVVDFLREYNLTLDAALQVSDHLPVWAEFSIFEGGKPGRLARLP